MTNLNAKIGEMEYDGLVSDITPKTEVRAGTIRKLSEKATLKRGTILAISSGTAGDGKLVVLGTTAASNETLAPHSILTDDIEVGTDADVSTTVYTAGCFNSDKVTVADNYTITAADLDTLRKYGIVFKAAFAGN